MLKVHIVGAGLAGLTLANALRQIGGYQILITDQDAQPTSRSQGNALTLRRGGALWALARLGLLAEAQRLVRPTSKFSLLTWQGDLLFQLCPPPDDQQALFGIDRGELRALLLDAYGADRIRWNAPCTGYRQTEKTITVIYADGSEEEADMVVGCNGVHSAIRQRMLGDSLRCLGLYRISGSVRSALDHPLLQDGSFMSVARGKSFFVQVYTPDAVLWSFATHGEVGQETTTSVEEWKATVLQQMAGWHAPCEELVRQTPPAVIRARDYYDRVPLKQARSGQCVLIGDAAHPMAPFRGMGANIAMVDAIRLADALRTHPSSPTEALRHYEQEMLVRTIPLVRTSYRAALLMHTRNPLLYHLHALGYRCVNAFAALRQRL